MHSILEEEEKEEEYSNNKRNDERNLFVAFFFYPQRAGSWPGGTPYRTDRDTIDGRDYSDYRAGSRSEEEEEDNGLDDEVEEETSGLKK